MALDGIMLAAIKNDLEKHLIKGRIDKIYQVDKYTITLLIRNNNKNFNLLISANPDFSRIHISKNKYDNPIKAPDFCMLLRKYLLRGTITNIQQPDFERLVNIEINIYNKKYNLISEVMGKYSNIIILNEEGIVLDAIKRVTPQISRERELYPGIKYKYPPRQDKLNPLLVTEEQFIEKTRDFNQASYKAIMYNLRGIGPDSAKEIVFRAKIKPGAKYNELDKEEKKNIWLELNQVISNIQKKALKPTIGLKNENIIYISPFPLKYLSKEETEYKDTGNLLDIYYQKVIIEKQLSDIKKQLISISENYIKKNHKKQDSFREKLKIGKNADSFKRKGELIKSNIYQLKRGMTEADVIDYYHPEQKTVTITLDPKLSPADNAQKYFKKYTKARKSIKYTKVQLSRLKHEVRYLDQVLLNIEQAESKNELAEIREELISEGYIKEKKRRKKTKSKNKPLPPQEFLSTEGFNILVGRNNTQNDYLTKKIANKHDIWLHVKDIAGSHVIIRNHSRDEIPDKTIEEAASLAAFYSKGRLSENVPVDYTEIKNVRKAKGAKPGLVYYEDYQTIYITADKKLMEKLKKD